MLRAFLRPFLRRLPRPGLFMNPFRRRHHGTHRRHHHHRRQVMPSRLALGGTLFNSRGGETLEYRQLLAVTTDVNPIGEAALVTTLDTGLVSGVELTETAVSSSVAASAARQVVVADDGGLNASAKAAWGEAVAQGSGLLSALPDRSDFTSFLTDIYGKAGTDPAALATAIDQLAADLKGPGLGITVEFLGNDAMQGALGAYAAAGPDGAERIYINAGWLNGGATVDAVRDVLLHEVGHAIDRRLNGSADSPGEEGELFADHAEGSPLAVGQLAAIAATDGSGSIVVNGSTVAVELATYTGTSGADTLTGSANADELYGLAGNDTIDGAGGNDLLIGGAGADKLTGGSGADSFYNPTGDMTISLGGSGDAGTISGFDSITDFTPASGSAVSESLRVNASGTATTIPANTGKNPVDGSDSSLTIAGAKVMSHAITNGIITFDDNNNYAAALSITSTAQVAAVVDYLRRNNIGGAGATVAFTATISSAARTYVYTQPGASAPGNSSTTFGLVELQGVTAASLTTTSSTTTSGALFLSDTLGDPTLTSMTALTGATEDTPFEITYATLLAASDAADPKGGSVSFRIEAVSTGTLEKWNGTSWAAVTAGTTTIGSGEKVRWTPAANANGTLNAFTVKASDGTVLSSTAVQVQVTAAAVNDAPTLTSVTPLTGAVQEVPFEITYATLFAAGNEADVDGDTLSFRVEAISSGTLEKWNGTSWTAATAGSTTLATGEKLRWTNALYANGTLNAFTVKAYDGSLYSSTAVQVQVTVSPDQTLTGTANADTIDGRDGNDTIDGAGGNDLLIGGTGADTLTGGAGADSFDNPTGDMTISLTGSGNGGAISGYDTITDFTLASGTAVSESLRVNASGTTTSIAPDTTATTGNGTNSSMQIGGNAIKSHKIVGGTVTFDDKDTFAGALSLTSNAHVAAVVDYLRRNDIGDAGATVAFTATISSKNYTYVYTQPGASAPGSTSTTFGLVELQGVAATSLVTTNATTSGALYLSDNLAAPTLTSVSTLTGATEDTAFEITYATLLAASDAADAEGDPVSFRIEAVSTGSLAKWNGTSWVAVTAGTTLVSSTEKLQWTPAANANGTLNAFTVKAYDGSLASSTAVQVKVTATSVNDAPTGTNKTVTMLEDASYTFAASDFGFGDANDSPANSLSNVIITALPSAATLKLSGTNVTLNQSISAANLGNLVFAPAANANGSSYATFSFKVQDDGGTANSGVDTSASANTVTVNVTAVNDAPTRTAGTLTAISVNEDSSNSSAVTLGLSAVTYGVGGGSDESSQTLTYTVTSIPSFITLFKADGTTSVTASTVLTALELQGLKYKTVANANGSGNVTWTVKDSGGTSNSGVDTLTENLSVTVASVNDAPTGTNKTVTILEDAGYTFAASDFGFGDANDSPANSLSNVIITALPSAGTLKLSGTNVTLNQSISAANLGNLVFAPAANANGSSYATFSFKVQDDGGTANSGLDTSASANTVTVNVTAVNDAPTLTTISTLSGGTEDTALEITYSTLLAASNAADVESDAISFRIEAVSTGTLQKWTGSAWASVTAGTTTIGTGEKLQWTPASNANGTLNAFTVKAYDGALYSSTAVQVQVSVAAVNDAPTLTTISTLPGGTEDAALEITYSTLLAASNAADVENDAISFRIEAVSTGTLQKWTGSAWAAVTAGTTTVGTGEKLQWTPAANANGTLNAFTVKAYDGALYSSTAVQVQVSVAAVNDAPTLTTISTLSGGTEDTALEITYATLRAASNAADVESDPISFRIEAVSTGTLQKWTGSAWAAVTAGTTTIGTGEKLQWTPAANANGTLNAFTVKAYDGALYSSTAVQVQVSVSAVNDAPTLTTISTLTGATEDTPFEITHSTLLAASNAADVENDAISFRIDAVSTGTLQKWTGSAWAAVTAGTTTIGTGEKLQWTPAANANGTLDAFTVKAYDGALASSTAVQVKVTLGAVNNAPSRTAGSLAAISVNEDSANSSAVSLGLSAVTYGPGGGSDEASQTLTYTVTSIPSFITLFKADGTTQVTASTVLTASELQGLTYKTVADANGTGNVTWTVKDSGGTTNGGVDTLTENLSVTVASVNDVPTRTAGSLAAISVNEDSANSSAVSLGLSAVTYGPGGGSDEASQTLTYTVTSIPSFITLFKADGTTQVTASTVLTASELQGLTYKTVADANGTGNVTWTVKDSGGTSNGGVDTLTENLSVTVSSVNDAPTGTDKTVTALEDGTYTFTAGDFGFGDASDSPANSFIAVKVTTLPAAGTLKLDGTAVTAGQVIAVADINDGKLVYAPAANANGAAYASFTFQVQDDGGTSNGGVDLDPSANTITVNVTSVNDAPTGTDKTVTVLEDGSYTFTTGDFGFGDASDTPANSLAAVKITTLPAAGTLKLDGTAVTAGQVVAVADITDGKLVYAPAANGNGAAYASFTFQVQDDGGTSNGGVNLDPSANTITVNVTSVNDAPSGANNTFHVHQNEPMLLTDSEFGFSDSDGNNRQSVIVTTLPTAGKLQFKNVSDVWVDVTASQEITFAAIMAGRLRFVPVTGAASTENYSSFTFQVRDDGGTANGGQDTDQSANTLTIHLLDSRGPKQTVPLEQTIDEDTSLVFSVANGNAISIAFVGEDGINNDAETIHTTLTVTAGTLNVGSSPEGLFIDGDGTASIVLEGLRSKVNAALDGLRFTPGANLNSVVPGGSHTFAVLTVDTVNVPAPGGFLYDHDTDAVDIGVLPVNDAPVATGSSTLAAVDEDTTSPAGATVASLFTDNFSDATDQVAGGSTANTLAGIAITAYTADSTKGLWQYSSDGTTWSNVPDVAGAASAFTLQAADSLRFLPALHYFGATPSLTVRLVDSSTTLTTGGTRDVSTNGGTTAVSATTVVLGSSVTRVLAPIMLTLASDSGTSGTDAYTNVGGIKATGQENDCTIQYSIDEGGSWGSSFTPRVGVNTVWARQTPDSKLHSAVVPGSKLTFTLDTSAGAPTVSLTQDTGSSRSDKVTREGALSVGGVETGALVEYATSTDGTNWSGWSETFAPTTDGTYTVKVRQTDIAGNVSSATPFVFTRDTAAAKPVVVLSSDTGTSTSDGITKVGLIRVSGTEVGARVEYSTDGTTWSGSFTAVQGDNAVYVRQTDLAGNESEAATLMFTFDSAAPAAPVLALGTGVTGGATAVEATQAGGVVTLTAELGSSVAVTFSRTGGGTVTKTVTGNGATPVSVVLTSDDLTTLGNGTILVSAKATDTAGNVGAVGANSFPLDRVAPATPVVALLSDTGLSTTDKITTNGALRLTGVEVGAVVEYSLDGGNNWTTSFTAQKDVNDVSVRQTDAAGNVSGVGTLTFTLDNTAPAAPTVALSSDTGSSDIDLITKTSGFSLGGIESGAKVEYSTNGTTWSTTFTPVQGANTVQVRQTDVAGNMSAVGSLTFTFDSVAPTAPALTLGTGVSGGATAAEATQAGGVVRLTAEAGSSVAVTFSRVGGGTVTKTVNGNGTTPVAVVLTGDDLAALGDGLISVSARATDAAGNVSLAGTTSFPLDTVAPTSPNAPAEAVTSKLGDGYLNSTEGATGTTIRVSLGTSGAVAGDVVELLTGGASFATAKRVTLIAADITNGYASFTVTGAELGADGTKSLSARVTDAAGNVGTIGSALTFIKDTAAPAAPVLTLGTGVSGGATAAEATQAAGVVRLTAEAGSTVAVTFSRSGGGTATKTVTGNGTTPVAVVLTSDELAALGDGTISVSAKAMDAAANTGLAGTSSFPLDTVAPTTPNAPAEAVTSKLGDGYLNATEGATGTTIRVGLGSSGAVVGDVVELLTGGASFTTAKKVTLIAADITNGYAGFTVTGADLGSDGTKVLSARVTDAAGNVGTIGSVLTFIKDTVLPAAPVLALGTGVSTGATAAEATQADGVVRVTAASGLSVAVAFSRSGGGTVTKTVTGNGATAVAVVLTSGDLATLGDGTISVSAKATNAIGNTSSAATTSFRLDTVSPTTPNAPAEAVTSKLGDGYLNATEGATGTTIRVGLGSSGAVAGDVVELLTGGASFSTAKKVTLAAADITNGYAGFTVTGTDLGSDGTKVLSARVTDAAGNVGTIGSVLTFIKDTVLPAAPVLALGTGVSTGATAAEATQADGVVRVTAASGLSVAVTFSRSGGGTVTKTVTGNGATAVAVVLTSGDLATLGDGTIAVSAKATNAVGNTSLAGTTSFKLDTVPPTVLNVVATGTGITSSGDGTLKAGATVTLTLTTSEAVTVTGTPSLALNSGSTAIYTRGSGTMTLVFTYTVGATDIAADLIVNGLLTSGGTLADAAGNALATFTFNPAGTLKIGG